MKPQIKLLYSLATAIATCWCALVISPDCLQAQKFQQDAWEKLMLDGRAAFDMRQYAAADRFFSSALFHRDSAGIRDVYLARVLYELAAVRGLTGRHGDAIRLITRAIDVLEALPEVDSAELAIASQGLGSAYLGVRAYPEAVQAYSRAIDLRVANGNAEPADVLPILIGLSSTYRAQHRNRDAEAALLRGKALIDNPPASGQPAQAWLLTSLGNFYLSERRFAEAMAPLLQAQSIVEDLVASAKGAAIPVELVRPYISEGLALAFFGQNHYEEAETLFAKALALGDQGAGMPPADFARILRGYARCLRKLGSKDDAKSLDSRAKAILGAPPGPGDFVVDASQLIRIK